MSDNGLSALLGIFDVYAGFDSEYEEEYTVVSLILLVAQIVVDLKLWKLKNAAV